MAKHGKVALDEEIWAASRYQDIHIAVVSNDLAGVEAILRSEHRVRALDSRTRLGETPLHLAVARSSRDVVRMLCACGADPNARKNAGSTPLHEAAWLGRDSATLILLRFGADVHAKDAAGSTPLALAKRHHRATTAAVLAERARELAELRTDSAAQAARHDWQSLVASKAARAEETAAVGPALWEAGGLAPRREELPRFAAARETAGEGPGFAAARAGGDGGGGRGGDAAGVISSSRSMGTSVGALLTARTEAGAAGAEDGGPAPDLVDAPSVARVMARAARDVLVLPGTEGAGGPGAGGAENDWSRPTSARAAASVAYDPI